MRRLLRLVCRVSRTGHVWTFGPVEVGPDPTLPYEYVFCMRCHKRKESR